MEARLFEEGTVPECATAEWYADRERAPHLEQPAHEGRLILAERMAADAGGPVVDLGAGDGGLLSRLRQRGIECWGYDLQPTNVQGAIERGVDVRLLDVVACPELVEWAPTVVCTETLEHLVDPHGFLAVIAREATNLVASSPAFETPESHYAFHLWCWDFEGYPAMIRAAGFQIVQHNLIDGFQVVWARK